MLFRSQADQGTIFLDEIGDMPLAMQAKLLRTLQEGTIVRLGGKREVRVEVRLVAATHRDLQADVAQTGLGQERRTPGRIASAQTGLANTFCRRGWQGDWQQRRRRHPCPHRSTTVRRVNPRHGLDPPD